MAPKLPFQNSRIQLLKLVQINRNSKNWREPQSLTNLLPHHRWDVRLLRRLSARCCRRPLPTSLSPLAPLLLACSAHWGLFTRLRAGETATSNGEGSGGGNGVAPRRGRGRGRGRRRQPGRRPASGGGESGDGVAAVPRFRSTAPGHRILGYRG